MQRCLSTSENSGDLNWDVISCNNVPTPSHVSYPTPLLREWVRLRLMNGPWKDALATAAGVSILFQHLSLSPDDFSACSLCFQDP